METQLEKNNFKSYLIFWIGQVFSIFGSNIVFFVLITWITVTTQDPIAVSFAGFSYFIPMIVISPIAGIVSDRHDRKKIIITADSLQAFSTFILILFFIFNWVQYWIILIFTLIRSTCQAFHNPVVNAIIPTMVPKDKLSRINGLNFLFSSFVNIIGPMVGGFLLLFFSVGQALWIDIITFLIALIPLLLIHIPSVKKSEEHHKEESYLSSFKDGLKIIQTIPGLFSMMIAFTILNFLQQPQGSLMPYYILVDNGGSVLEFSIVATSFSIGTLIGGVITSVKKKWKHYMRVILITYMISATGQILIATAPRGFIYLIAIFAPLVGLGGPIINSLWFTMIHLKVPHDKVGRVVSIDTTLSFIAMPIGTLLAGPLALFMGTAPLFIIAAILIISTMSCFYIFTNIRALGVMEEEEKPEIIN
ncbi:MAG: MFS transporter [Promethearchaeota archaeon]